MSDAPSLDDCRLLDDYLSAVVEQRYSDAIKLYLCAPVGVKELFFAEPRELLVSMNPELQSGLVLDFLCAYRAGDELGMRRAFRSANDVTRVELRLFID